LGLVGFVDDCNGPTNTFGKHTNVHQLAQQVQENAQVWSNYLGASGGLLELSKCSVYVLQWNFTQLGAPVLALLNHMNRWPITVTQTVSEEKFVLPTFSPYHAHKTLGHYKEPAGAQKEQYRQLYQKSLSCTAFLWKTPLTRPEAWLYYRTTFLPAISYPLACSFFSRRQLDTLQTKSMSIIFARCGYNRNTKREILYGPMELGGASFRTLFVQQGTGQVTQLLKHMRTQSQVGVLMRIAISWFQEQVGVSFFMLENPHRPLPHLESKWFASVRNFLHTIKAGISIYSLEVPQLQRQNDVYLMDVILEKGNFIAAEIRRLNYCRLYLGAITLSDITTVNGTLIDPGKKQGMPSLFSSLPIQNIIVQERPADKEWKLWAKAQKLWTHPDGSVITALGPWSLPIKNIDNSISRTLPEHWHG
jgi:hypothetical protein